MTRRIVVLTCVVALCALVVAPALAQIPGIGSLPTSLDKGQLLQQAQKLLSQLTAMKQDPNLSAADKSKVDSLMPKATSLNDELSKPTVETSKLPQLASQLGDLEKEVGSLKGMMK